MLKVLAIDNGIGIHSDTSEVSSEVSSYWLFEFCGTDNLIIVSLGCMLEQSTMARRGFWGVSLCEC